MDNFSNSTIDPFKAADGQGRIRTVTHQPQETPLDSVQSRHQFDLCGGKTILTTAAVERQVGGVVALQSLVRLDMFAKLNNGLDYFQVFQIEDLDQDLWVIEDGEAITAMLPSDY